MSTNPPILSIPAQSPDPVSHINAFLASLAPHVSEHAAIGIREFSSQDAQPRGKEGWRGRARSLDVDPGLRGRSEGMPRADFRLVAGAGEGSWGHGFQRHDDPLDSLNAPTKPLNDRVPRIIPRPQAVYTARGLQHERVPLDHDMSSVDSTESTQRRHARKIRRREKAAILNARPSPSPTQSAHPHPAPKRRSPESDSDAERALSEILSGERRTVGGRGKRRRMQPGMDMMRRWKPENVVTSRLTMRPGMKGLKGGILGKAKTSLPIRAPYWDGSKAGNSDGKRVHGIAESEDEMHLWRRRPAQRRGSQGHSPAPAPNTSERTHSNAVRSSSRGFEQESRNVRSSNPLPTRYDRLPSAGITNSPSWPSFTTHHRSDPPALPAHTVHAVDLRFARHSGTGSMGYEVPSSSLDRSARRVPHTAHQAPLLAPRPAWETGPAQPAGSQPNHQCQSGYQHAHPLQHIYDLSSSFAQHLGIPQTTRPPRNGKSPLYPIRRTIYGRLLPRDHASSEVKTMSSSPLFQRKMPTFPSSPITFGEPSELRGLNGPTQPVGDSAGSRSGAVRERDRRDVHVRVDLSSSPITSTSVALPKPNTDSSPPSMRIPVHARRDHHPPQHAFQSIVDPTVRRTHEFTAVDGVAYRGTVPPMMEWDGAYGTWNEFRDEEVPHAGVGQAGQTAGQTEESGRQAQWRSDGMESGSFFGPRERGPWSVSGEGFQWIGDVAYAECGEARGDDVHMGMGMGLGMGSGVDGIDRDPPPRWQGLDRGAQVGPPTLHRGDDEWKRFWQGRNEG